MLCNYDTGILASSNSNISSVSISSPVWTVGANMTTPRTDFTGTVLNQNVYIIGGFSEDDSTIDIVEFYDPNTDTLYDAAPLPEPLDHALAATHNEKIYVVGGYRNDRTPSDRLFIYNRLTDNWQEGEPLPMAKTALTGNFIKGTLYVVGV